MGTRFKYFNILLHLILLKSSAQSVPVRSASYEFYVENARIRRQAGYVYKRPNISFDLPSQTATVTTQAPNVDRTQAQQMYYAYPAPVDGDTVNIGYSSGASSGATTARTSAATASSGSSNAGYNYGAQGGGGASGGERAVGGGGGGGSGATGYNYGAQGGGGASGGGAVAVGGGGSGATGYNYDAQGTVGSDDADSSGYNYGAQSGSGGARGGVVATSVTQTTTSSGSSQASVNSGSSQSIIGSSGYSYNTPITSPGSETDVSTNAPKYLPPTGNDSSNVNTGSQSTVSPSGTVPAIAQQPSDSYLPPVISTNTQASFDSTGLTNVQIVTNPAPVPNPNYIPPSPSQPSPPFPIPGPGKPSTEYLPPLSNPGSPPLGTIPPPSSTYLPPVF